MLIGGFQKSSLIDYPEKISAIVFTQGCNFSCPYCHNPELICPPPQPSPLKGGGSNLNPPEILTFLKSRIGKLDAVVITGGEPTLHKDLPEFIGQIKDLGFLVKLDTNGTNPEMLRKLIDEKLINYVAMDIKAPIEKYSEIVCAKVDTEKVLKSIEILTESDIDFEFRTTVVKSQLTFDDFEKIGELIKGSEKYYLQKFVPRKTLNRFYMNQTTYSGEEFEKIAKSLKKFVNQIIIR